MIDRIGWRLVEAVFTVVSLAAFVGTLYLIVTDYEPVLLVSLAMFTFMSGWFLRLWVHRFRTFILRR